MRVALWLRERQSQSRPTSVSGREIASEGAQRRIPAPILQTSRTGCRARRASAVVELGQAQSQLFMPMAANFSHGLLQPLAGYPFRSRICQGKHSVVLRSGSAAGVRFGRAVARQASSLWNSVEPFASGSMRPGAGCRLKQGRQCSGRVLVALSRKTRGWRGSTARWRTPSLWYRGAEPLCRPWSIRPHTSQTDFRTGLLQVSTTGIGVAALTGLGWTRIPMPPAISTLGCTATGVRCGCPAAR